MAMQIVEIKIAGYEVVTDEPVRWPLTFGASAPAITWKLDPGLADEVLKHRITKIEVTDNYGVQRTIENVVVMGEGPREDKYSKVVELSNVLALLAGAWLRRQWSFLTRTGTLHRVGSGGVQQQTIAPVVDFVRYTLGDDNQALTYSQMLDNAAKACETHMNVQIALLGEGKPVKWSVESGLAGGYKPNEVEIDDPATDALPRLMAKIGGIDLFVGLDSNPKIVKRLLGDERKLIEAKGLGINSERDLGGEGKLTWIELWRVRPRKVTCGYTPEVEFMARNKEGGDFGANDPFSINLLKVTDVSLVVNGQTVPTSAKIPASDWFAAVKAKADYPASAGALDAAKVERMWLGRNFGIVYVMGGLSGLNPNPIWSARIGAVMMGFRLDFRINPLFMGGVQPGSLRAHRCTITDPATGIRQKSPVFVDYAEKPTEYWLQKTADMLGGWNIDSLPWADGPFPPDGTNPQTGLKSYLDKPTLDQMRVASLAEVSITDALTGEYRFNFLQDQWGEAQQIVPCRVKDIPTIDPTKVALATALLTWENCSLDSSYQHATVLSAIPGGPNDERQFSKYPTDANPALERLKVPDDRGTRQEGPERFVHVQPALATALIQYTDDVEDQILGWYTATKGVPAITPANDDVLKDLSIAIAAGVYAPLLDHYEGTQGIELDFDVEPSGSLFQVSHVFGTKGDPMTYLSCGARVPPTPPENLMSTGTRRIILHEVQR